MKKRYQTGHCIATKQHEELKKHLTDPNHEKSQERFVNGTKTALGFIENLMIRRVHRLPKSHPDYSEKVE